MKVYIVNLDRDKERMTSCKAQLDALGVAFERFPAIYSAGESNEIKYRELSRMGWWCAMGRPIRDGELGCTMTHNAIYRKMVKENIPFACVLEDDILVNEHLPKALVELEGILNSKVSEIVLLTNYTKYASARHEIIPTDQNSSTEAYVLTRAAAQAILKVNDPICVPCDHWQRFARRGKITIRQYFPTPTTMHIARFGSYSAPIGTGRYSLATMGVTKWSLHKLKRLLGVSIDKFKFLIMSK